MEAQGIGDDGKNADSSVFQDLEPQAGMDTNDEANREAEQERLRREKEARAQALTLEIVGDLPYAEVKPPENVLFVCKLNPVTEGEHGCTLFARICS